MMTAERKSAGSERHHRRGKKFLLVHDNLLPFCCKSRVALTIVARQHQVSGADTRPLLLTGRKLAVWFTDRF